MNGDVGLLTPPDVGCAAMKRLSRMLLLAISSGLFSPSPPLLSPPKGPRRPEPLSPKTTVAPVDFEPAVPVTTPDTIEPLPDWTYRYMVPTGIVLALLVAVITSVQYFTRVVRERYRIVEE